MVDAPKTIWLMQAYLAHRFDQRKSETGLSWDKIGREIGLSKQQMLSQTEGGTLGALKLFDVIEIMWDGKPEKMITEARAWWGSLTGAEKHRLSFWAKTAEKRRTSPKRGVESHAKSGGDAAQLRRIAAGTKGPSAPPSPTKLSRKSERP